MEAQLNFSYDSEGSQEQMGISNEDDTPRVDDIAEDATTDSSRSELSSLDSDLYNNLAFNVYTSPGTPPPETLDSGVEYFNTILRPAGTETNERSGYALPMSMTAAMQHVPFPDALQPVLSLESPSLGHVDINKGCFELIQLHVERSQQLERELEELRKERRDLDTELLCRGEDIAHYKKEIERLKENQQH
ncbi:hypothetical protein PG997_010715 [Apiospora hydei]|uniref:Uncharacterized protein n=1 Tax=Apiospora hydei TaxID=1337664 RepID=A0ABR1VH91_9PEZI